MLISSQQASVVDLVCILPVAQQAIGLGSVVFNIIKITKEIFTLLYYLLRCCCDSLFLYPLVDISLQGISFDSATKKIHDLDEEFKKSETLLSRKIQIVQEMNNITLRLARINTFFEAAQAKNREVEKCVHQIKIGFYRFIPIVGTIYSLKKCAII